MKLISDGLKFIINTSLTSNRTLGLETEILLSNGKTPGHLYVPSQKEKGFIISLTGFSMTGYKDSRIAVVNNAFKKLGYRVITPKIDTIDNLLIHPQAIDEMKELIQSISNDPILNPNQFTPSVFAPSFTGGIAALAIADMPKDSVSALCLLGSFCDFESTIQFALTNEENMDNYGMHVLMKNFLKYEIGENAEMEELLQTALEDNGLKRTTPLLPKVKAKSNPETVELYENLVNNTAFRKDVIMGAWAKIPEFAKWKDQLDLSIHAHKISCPVSIIHGKHDNVIPSKQSVLLHSLIKEKNRNVHLELSNLLDHGDLKISSKIFVEIANLAKAFNFFSSHCGKLLISSTKN